MSAEEGDKIWLVLREDVAACEIIGCKAKYAASTREAAERYLEDSVVEYLYNEKEYELETLREAVGKFMRGEASRYEGKLLNWVKLFDDSENDSRLLSWTGDHPYVKFMQSKRGENELRIECYGAGSVKCPVIVLQMQCIFIDRS